MKVVTLMLSVTRSNTPSSNSGLYNMEFAIPNANLEFALQPLGKQMFSIRKVLSETKEHFRYCAPLTVAPLKHVGEVPSIIA